MRMAADLWPDRESRAGRAESKNTFLVPATASPKQQSSPKCRSTVLVVETNAARDPASASFVFEGSSKPLVYWFVREHIWF